MAPQVAAPPTGPLLAIDTSSAQASVALYDGMLLSVRSWPADRSHTTMLLTEIHHLLDSASLAVGALGAIGIAAGPGAFTGLRVGFGVAKGFHLATGLPLIGVSTLAATAFPFAVCRQSIVAVVAAGRSRLVWAHYLPVEDAVHETRPPRNGTLDELRAEIVGMSTVIVVGELDENQAHILAGTGHALVPPRPIRMRQPTALAELAWRRWRVGAIDDPILLEPLYLSRTTESP